MDSGKGAQPATSGNVLADRRMEMARQMASRGDHDAAADIMAQALEIAPDWVEGWFYRGETLMHAGQDDAAAEAFKACLRLNPGDRMGAGIKLAILGRVDRPDTMPEAYVRGLFDQYAPRFDTALVERLDYRAPGLMRRAVDAFRPGGGEHILDLGCGTGLAGEAFRDRASVLDGVDLSPSMVEHAARKGVYDHLAVADIGAWLSACTDHYDMVLAADVLVYIGALEGLFAALARVMTPGGLFCFTVQNDEGESFTLGADHRYAYSRAYLARCGDDAGWRLAQAEDCILRKDGDRAVAGSVCIAVFD